MNTRKELSIILCFLTAFGEQEMEKSLSIVSLTNFNILSLDDQLSRLKQFHFWSIYSETLN